MSTTAREQLDQLNRQIKELVGIYRDAMTALGHSENEFWIWYALIVMGEDYAQQDICGMWSLNKQTVNNIVSRMVKDGHVTLEAVPGTRNRKIIRPTEAGRAYGERLVLPVCNIEQKAFARLSETDRRAFMNALHLYIGFFKEELGDIQPSAE